MPGPRRTRLSPDARRSQLLEVTERLVLERGEPAVTLEDIAAGAGVTVQLIYHYFDSRDALLGRTLEAAFARFDDEVGQLIAAATTFEAKLRVLCRQAFEPLPSLGVARSFNAHRDGDGEVARSLDAHAIGVGLFVADLLRAELDIDEPRAIMTAAAILGATQAFEATRAAVGWSRAEAEDLLVAISLAIAMQAANGGLASSPTDEHNRAP